MNVGKKIVSSLIICAYTLSLCSCATTYDRGYGVVQSVRKIQGRDYKPHEGTKTGAEIGGATGAIGGAAAGGLAGIAIASLANVTTPVLIASILGGAAIGAAIVGGAGAATGAGLGYVVDLGSSNSGLYQYTVKPDDNAKPITVTQYSADIPVDARVHILEKDKTVFIQDR